MYQDILLSVEARVATITLNRPQVSNALSKASYGEIQDAVSACEQDEQVGCIVITGAGKHFSAGGDIASFKRLIESGAYLSEDSIRAAAGMSSGIRRCCKPVVAMINGVATGAGLSVALACDFRIGTPSSKLIMAFIKMGLSGDTGSILLLHKLVGAGTAAEMIMTGAPVGGEQAHRLGLFSRLAEEGQLEAETYAFARTLANGPLFALKKQKELINAFFYSELDAFTEAETKAMAACSRTKDFEEAVNAFSEKRTPQFTGQSPR